MTASLEIALSRLDGALDQLEAAVHRRMALERRRGDIEVELQLMQDDRARLAMELDGTTARLSRVESVAGDVGRRVRRAAAAVREVLHEAEARPAGDEAR